MHANRDGVMETSTTLGLGAYALAGAVIGFRTFEATGSVGIGNTCDYAAWAVDDLGNRNGAWETGLGTVGSGTLARTTVVDSSAGGNPIDWGAGTKRVACSPLASKLSGPAPTGDLRRAAARPGELAADLRHLAGRRQQRLVRRRRGHPGYRRVGRLCHRHAAVGRAQRAGGSRIGRGPDDRRQPRRHPEPRWSSGSRPPTRGFWSGSRTRPSTAPARRACCRSWSSPPETSSRRSSPTTSRSGFPGPAPWWPAADVYAVQIASADGECSLRINGGTATGP
jgi:hypothetical protein